MVTDDVATAVLAFTIVAFAKIDVSATVVINVVVVAGPGLVVERRRTRNEWLVVERRVKCFCVCLSRVLTQHTLQGSHTIGWYEASCKITNVWNE